MKKFLAIVLAFVLCLSLGVTAFAEGEGEEAAASGPSVTPDNITVVKTYESSGGTTYPEETLTFNVEPAADNLGGVSGNVVVGTNNTYTTNGAETYNIPVSFPTYTKVGVYKYTITEIKGETAGVTYDEAPLYVVVTITNALGSDAAATSDQLVATVAVHKGAEDGEKEAKFDNEYGMGQLTVTKQVTGNLASNTEAFDIVVTFTCENASSDISYTVAGSEAQTLTFSEGTASVTVALSNAASAVFTNIPSGTTYTVVEDTKYAGANPADTGNTKETNSWLYDDAKYDFSDDEQEIKPEDKDTCTVTNNKETEVDTGIMLDSLPYVLVIAVVLSTAVVMFVRKRRSEV